MHPLRPQHQHHPRQGKDTLDLSKVFNCNKQLVLDNQYDIFNSNINKCYHRNFTLNISLKIWYHILEIKANFKIKYLQYKGFLIIDFL